MTKEARGTLYTLGAGLSWGLSGVSGEYLMAQGVHVNLLTSLRLVLAGLVLTLIAYVTDRNKLKQMLQTRRTVLGLLIFTVFGLVLNQYAYLSAIQHTNAGTATVLQYITPVLVLLYACLRHKTWPTLIEVFAISLAIGGTFIMATHGKLTGLAITPTGLLWGILSAFTYAAYLLIPVPLIQQWGSLHVIGLSMLMGGLCFPLMTQAWQYPFEVTGPSLLALFGLVAIGTVFAYTVFLQGVSMIGAVKGSLLASVEPVASVLLTVLIMGNQFYVTDVLGMILIIGAVLLISFKDLLAQKEKHQLTN